MALQTSHPTQIQQVFSVDKLIPIYQRNFVWNEMLRSDFFNDLVDAFEQGEEYFIGSMVFRRNEEGVYEVVDGQQRITTMFVLVSCAVHLGLKLDSDCKYEDKFAEYKRDLYKSKLVHKDLIYEPSLVHADPVVNKAYVSISRGLDVEASESDTPMIKNLKSAQQETADLLKQFVDNEQTDSDKAHRLATFLEFIYSRVVCIHHVATELDTALTIFGRLNATGVTLTKFEIMKGMSFQSAAGEGTWQAIEEEWKKLEEILFTEIQPGGKGHKTQLIQHDTLLMYKLFVDLPDIGRTFNKNNDAWVSQGNLARLLISPELKETLRVSPIPFIGSITDFLKQIRALRVAEEADIPSTEVRNYLHDIASVAKSQSQWLMVAVPLRRHFPASAEAFRALRNMVYIFSHVQTGSGSSAGTYMQLASQLSEAQLGRPPSEEDLARVIGAMRSKVVSLWGEYEAQLRGLRYGESGDPIRIKRALQLIEVELNRKYNVGHFSSLLSFSFYKGLNVDHLQPTSLSRVSEDHQHQLGNLALLNESSNKGLQDTEFENNSKLEALASSEFWATKSLAPVTGHGKQMGALGHFTTRNEMNEIEIEERTEEIVVFLQQCLTE